MLDRKLTLLVMALLAMALSQTRVATRLEETWGLAWLYDLRGVVQPPEGAAIIGIDEDSASWLQRNAERLVAGTPGLQGCLDEDAAARLGAMRSASELPRDVFACLIDVLAAEKPKLLIFDVYFTVAQPQDGKLAASIRRAGNVLLLAHIGEQPGDGRQWPSILMQNRPVSALEKASLATVGFLVERPPGSVTTRYLTRIAPFPDLPVLPVEARRRGGGAVPPLPERQTFWLYGPPRTIPTWSVREVFEPLATHPVDVRGKVVFIGGSSLNPAASRDTFAVPGFSGVLSGVELGATAYLNLVAAQRLSAPGAAGRAALAGAIVVAFAAAALFLPRRLAIASVLLFAPFVSGTALALFHRGIWLPVATPLLLGLLVAALTGLERRLRFARGLAVAILPHPLSKQLLHDGSAAPRTQVASAMFLDMAGSTGLAERYGPDMYTRIMAEYYRLVTDAVDRNGGAVYKYEGDGILALFFGRPAQDEDTRSVLEAARRIASTALAHMAARGLPSIGIRIGISTGPIAVGMLRFGEHASVSTMGDAIHRAYRLQEMGRDLLQKTGRTAVVTLLDGETAARARQNKLPMRFHTNVILRGRSAPTSVYHLTA